MDHSYSLVPLYSISGYIEIEVDSLSNDPYIEYINRVDINLISVQFLERNKGVSNLPVYLLYISFF